MTKEIEATSPLPERVPRPPGFKDILKIGVEPEMGADLQARSQDAIDALEGADEFAGMEMPGAPMMLGAPQRRKEPKASLPIWEHFGSVENPDVYQLKIQYVSQTGVVEELGFMPADAGQEELIALHRKPGKYRVMPVDEHGRPQAPTPYVVVISRDHPFYSRLGEDAALLGAPTGAPVFMGAPGPGASPLLEYVTKQGDALKERQNLLDRVMFGVSKDIAEMSKASVEAEAKRSTDMLATTVGTLSEHSKGMREEQARAHAAQMAAVEANAKAHTQLVESFAGKQQESMSTVMALVVQLSASADKDRREREIERERERDRREDERARERREFEARERERQEAREREREAERLRSEDRDREHMKAMMTLMQAKSDAQNPMVAFTTLMAAVIPLANAMGITGEDMRGLVRRVVAAGEEAEPAPPPESSGFMAEMFKTVRSGIDAFRAMSEAQAAMAQAGAEPDDDEEEIDEGTGQPALPDHGPDFNTIPTAPAQAFIPDGFARPPPPRAQAHQPNIPEGFARPVPKPNPLDVLDPQVRQTGRRVVGALVEKLRTTPQEGWEHVFQQALFSRPADTGPVAQYLQAATIRGAARDAGADPQLVEGFVLWLDAQYGGNPIIAAIPRG